MTLDPDRTDPQRAANLRRRVAMLRYHVTMRGGDGKSVAAQRGGHARMGGDAALARATATEMALKRWHDAPSAPTSTDPDHDG